MTAALPKPGRRGLRLSGSLDDPCDEARRSIQKNKSYAKTPTATLRFVQNNRARHRRAAACSINRLTRCIRRQRRARRRRDVDEGQRRRLQPAKPRRDRVRNGAPMIIREPIPQRSPGSCRPRRNRRKSRRSNGRCSDTLSPPVAGTAACASRCAARMRPQSLDTNSSAKEQIVGPGRALRRAIRIRPLTLDDPLGAAQAHR